MASQSVATPAKQPGSMHGLWMDTEVLTICIDKASKEFPPSVRQTQVLNTWIQELARAAKSVMYQAQNDAGNDETFVLQPIETIANTIIMLSMLSEAIHDELRGTQEN